MIVDWGSKTIQAKVVYFGPAMSGKTTNLRYLFKEFGGPNQMQSIETTTGRTLFFDWGPLFIQTGGDFVIRVDCWSVTGQNFYAGTRPSVLMGTDGVIFVSDAQPHYVTDNVESFQELKNHFGKRLGQDIPLVVCHNKTDLENAIDYKILQNQMEVPDQTPVLRTIATKGENVTEAFMLMLKLIFKK